jgi:hypothetical protein
VGSTTWGARLEPNSTAKAVTYRTAAETMAADAQGPGAQCLGGYAFKWGWKEQMGVTWVNLLQGYPLGGRAAGWETTAAVDEISRTWHAASERPALSAPGGRARYLARQRAPSAGARTRMRKRGL